MRHLFAFFVVLISWSAMVSQSNIQAMDLSPTEAAIVGAVEANIKAEIAFLEEVVNINSGTLNLVGVRETGAAFRLKLDALGFETEWLDLPEEMSRAGHLVARHQGGAGKQLLLIGHLDTVFPIDSPFQKYEVEGNVARGPGISDMKAGDVILVYALKALADAGALEGKNISALFTGDEESVGSPIEISRAPMIKLAELSDYALSFEGGKLDEATIARRGSSGWRLTVTGKRAHSSGIFNDQVGAGAVFETARILNAFYETLRGEEYLTFNPGLVLGGTFTDLDLDNSRGTAFGKTNVVAQSVTVNGGLRFLTEEQKERARAKMREIVAQNLPRTSAEIEFADRYPGMAPTEGNWAMFEVLKAINNDLGFPELSALDPGRRGAGDISFVAPIIDSIDGIGGTGSGAHSVSETLELDSLLPMTTRAALLIHRLSQQ